MWVEPIEICIHWCYFGRPCSVYVLYDLGTLKGSCSSCDHRCILRPVPKRAIKVVLELRSTTCSLTINEITKASKSAIIHIHSDHNNFLYNELILQLLTIFGMCNQFVQWNEQLILHTWLSNNCSDIYLLRFTTSVAVTMRSVTICIGLVLVHYTERFSTLPVIA